MRWHDGAFRRERNELFALLLDSFADGGWELFRPEPRSSTTGKLDERDCDLVEPPASTHGASDDEERLAAALDALLLPAIRPLAEKLVENEHLRARELSRMLEAASSAEGANDTILEIAYDVLSADAIEAGKRLSLLRGPQRWNGVAGPFALRDGDLDWTADLCGVPLDAAREIVRGGWLPMCTEPDGRKRVAMANALRAFLEERATTTGAARVRREHRWLAGRAPAGVEESVEIHHHAVESGDGALARSTGEHYGADLRRIAYARSKREDATSADFEAAADIYRVIVREFDSEDAYAWHYLGYNLAMQHRERPLPPAIEREIVDAYAQASRCEPTNPLYKGREVGFLARIGRNVQADLKAGIARFRLFGGRKAMVIFSQRVLEGMSTSALLDLAGKPWAGDLLRDPELGEFFR
jgi:hypothetical protein